MKIVVKKVGYEPEVKEINNELSEFQDIVGGYIECVSLFDNVVCVCNEEGKLLRLTPNFIFNGDVIVGDVFFCAAGEEDFESLNDEQIDLVMTVLDLFGLRKQNDDDDVT